MIRRAMLVALAVVAISAPLRAQEPDPLYTAFSYGTRVQIMALIDSAQTLGLPGNPLRRLALQGKSRGRSDREILRVVRSRMADLERAQKVLGRDATEAELDAAADAMLAQIPASDIAQFNSASRDRSPAAVLVILTDLVNSRGVPRAEATSALLRLWRAGANDEALQGLWREVGRDILDGTNPGDAFQNRVRAVAPPSRPPEI